MSNIPEHILAEARRLAAEGMPLEQIAFFTRIDAEVIGAELKRQNTNTVTDTVSEQENPTSYK
jgi:hypothetical protein